MILSLGCIRQAGKIELRKDDGLSGGGWVLENMSGVGADSEGAGWHCYNCQIAVKTSMQCIDNLCNISGPSYYKLRLFFLFLTDVHFGQGG